MNRVILLGNVGRDPRIRMADGTTVAEFSLATSERRHQRNADGRTWEDRNAIKRNITEIYVDSFELLPK